MRGRNGLQKKALLLLASSGSTTAPAMARALGVDPKAASTCLLAQWRKGRLDREAIPGRQSQGRSFRYTLVHQAAAAVGARRQSRCRGLLLSNALDRALRMSGAV